jgi:hypothetical protein
MHYYCLRRNNMKIGDLIRIKDPALLAVDGYIDEGAIVKIVDINNDGDGAFIPPEPHHRSRWYIFKNCTKSWEYVRDDNPFFARRNLP